LSRPAPKSITLTPAVSDGKTAGHSVLLFVLSKISLKLRLLVGTTLAMFGIMVLGAVLLLQQARTAVQSELRSGRELLAGLAQTAMSLHAQSDSEISRRFFREWLQSLAHVRHIQVIDSVRSAEHLEPAGQIPKEVPAWFADLLHEDLIDEPTSIQIDLGAGTTLTLRTNPSDEILEAWAYVRPLLNLSLLILAFVAVLSYWTLWWGLKPLDALLSAFARIESGDMQVRLSSRGAPELVRLEQGFNHMANALREAMARNRELGVRLVNSQENERRAIARELHDEMAPYLFAARAELLAAQSLKSGEHGDHLHRKLAKVEEKVSQIQTQIDNLLRWLRPVALDEWGLQRALEILIDGWRIRLPQTCWRLNTIALPENLASALRVAVYRIVQECLTNAAKHAGAHEVVICIGQEDECNAQSSLRITVQDDGCGMSPSAVFGHGLSGVQERVQAFGGTFTLSRGTGAVGTRVEVCLPIATESAPPDANADA
jgi:two-component system sensor histidine kinase UhpB